MKFPSTDSQAFCGFVGQLRTHSNSEAKRLGTNVEQPSGDHAPKPAAAPASSFQPPPRPAPAGSDNILSHLKRLHGMLPASPVPPSTTLGPDHFELLDESPLREEHALVSELLEQVQKTDLCGTVDCSEALRDLTVFPAGRRALTRTPMAMGHLLLAAAERHAHVLLTPSLNVSGLVHDYARESAFHYARHLAVALPGALINERFELSRAELFDLLLYMPLPNVWQRPIFVESRNSLVKAAGHYAAASPLSEGERYVLSLVRASLTVIPHLGTAYDDITALTTLINDGLQMFLVPGEAWSDAVNFDVSKLDSAGRNQWAALLRHLLKATGSRPAEKWQNTARGLIAAIGAEPVGESLARWFPQVARGLSIRRFGQHVGDSRSSSDTIQDDNAVCLKGFLWCVPLLPTRDELARDVTAVALSAYRKVPGVGPRAVKVGNAGVYALSELKSKEVVGQLAMLKVRVKFGTAQKEIDKAFTAAAEALKLPREQIEEMGVPSYGLEEVGRLQEELAGYSAELVVTGSNAELHWSDGAGKRLKSVPAKVKSECKDELKELQQSLKDIQAMLPAQRDRIDGMFLLQKSWAISDWRERYHDHPLVGTIARRLLWCIDGTPALFERGIPCDVRGVPIEHGATAEVMLWHPIGQTPDSVVAWRRRLEELKITQPFKQAHREIYLLTDAERNTHNYSNRFAAHILRQHQFSALCAARGWKNRLRLMVDAAFPPATRELPNWGLRAEFWIEGVGRNYGIDTNDSGVYLRLSTDQVRFYRSEAAENLANAGSGVYMSLAVGPGEGNINEPLPLDQVPPLVFSEVMRDVDMFVGVTSVAADPAWQDGGPEARYSEARDNDARPDADQEARGRAAREYWRSFNFGELTATAAMRKDVLERLVPRLKIANRCSFSDRFLIVRGDKRTYKIHLGSGNILMEPNDQYLCIVPDSRARAASDDLYLPFDGDSTLSIIVSKALLLADDTKIKDRTIMNQINSA